MYYTRQEQFENFLYFMDLVIIIDSKYQDDGIVSQYQSIMHVM